MNEDMYDDAQGLYYRYDGNEYQKYILHSRVPISCGGTMKENKLLEQQYADKCLELIAEKETSRKAENTAVHYAAIIDAIEYMVEGEVGKNEPSDFMMSFSIVRDVWDYFQHYEAEVSQLKERVTELLEINRTLHEHRTALTSGGAVIPDVGYAGCITRCEKCGNWLEVCKCKAEKKWKENNANLRKSLARKRRAV